MRESEIANVTVLTCHLCFCPMKWAGYGASQSGSSGGSGGKSQEDQAAQQEEMKRQMLSRILDAEARERRKCSPLPLLILLPQY